jgi:dTDP-4-amino-4,6-dideoxygalactose transaminase
MIPIAEPSLGKEELNNVIEAVKSGWISSKGDFIEEFERNFSSYCDRKYGVATSNGTVALHLALKALGIGKDDEVIIPDLTFVAVANTVTYCNAKPVFVDSHPNYWCIDPEKIEEKITPRTKADHGMNPNRRYWYDIIGFNYRMTNLQAAIGVAQLKKLDKFVEKKRQIAKQYSEELKDLEERGVITLHPEMSWAKSVYWMFCILVDDKFGMSRDDLMKKLEQKGIDTRPFFYPMHVMPPYKNNEEFTVAEGISRKGINLPSGVGLTKEDVERIVNEIRSFKN